MTFFVPKKPESHRQKRVCSLLQSLISKVILNDNLIAKTPQGKLLSAPTSLTVTGVNVSPDFSHASIYVMPLGGEKQDETLTYLKGISPQLRHRIAKEINLRVTPQLHFFIDKTFENAERIDRLFSKISDDPKTPH
jgi:ribosome-binding factor A